MPAAVGASDRVTPSDDHAAAKPSSVRVSSGRSAMAAQILLATEAVRVIDGPPNSRDPPWLDEPAPSAVPPAQDVYRGTIHVPDRRSWIERDGW